MDVINDHILSKLQSKIVTRDEFNFDMLSARPLLSMMSYTDLDKLYNIASSIRYSGNIEKKLNAIKEVMHPLGFRKAAQGTNRIVYNYLEDPSIVLKIATDRVGLKDNPAEFLNQEKLKPFVTKVFEVTPDGAVGEFERVLPITSREEYLSCASDIYELLNIITSKYIMADIGTRYFMNAGHRLNFGEVLLDFPYLYELDGNKLQCKAPDPNSEFGICNGWIDYDTGFNELRCIKCGAVYKAVELAKDIREHKIVRKGSNHKMKVAAINKNGKVVEHNLNGEIVNNNEFKASTAIVKPKVETTNNVGKLKVTLNTRTMKPIEEKPVEKVEIKEEPKKVEIVEEAKVEEKVEIVPEIKVETPVESKEEKVEQPVQKVEEQPKKKSMKVQVTQDGKTTEKVIDKKVEPKKTPNVKVSKDFNRFNNRVKINAITLEQLKELDLKYSSVDLEFHKIFFKSEYAGATVSVMADFDSIPNDRLCLLAGIESGEEVKAVMENNKAELEHKEEELEQAKADILSLEEHVENLRKIISSKDESIKGMVNKENDTAEMIQSFRNEIEKLQKENEALKISNPEDVKVLNDEIAKLKQQNNELGAELMEAENLKEKVSELESINEQQHIQLERLLKENEELKNPPVVEEEKVEEPEVVEDVVESTYEEEEEDEYSGQPKGFSFISGTMCDVNQLADKYGITINEEEIPSDRIIIFTDGEDKDSYIVRDANNNIVAVSWIMGKTIDDLKIIPREK